MSQQLTQVHRDGKHKAFTERKYDMTSRFRKAQRLVEMGFVAPDNEGGYLVMSESYAKNGQTYGVYRSDKFGWMCTCHDFAMTQRPCKHCFASLLFKRTEKKESIIAAIMADMKRLEEVAQ